MQSIFHKYIRSSQFPLPSIDRKRQFNSTFVSPDQSHQNVSFPWLLKQCVDWKLEIWVGKQTYLETSICIYVWNIYILGHCHISMSTLKQVQTYNRDICDKYSFSIKDEWELLSATAGESNITSLRWYC